MSGKNILIIEPDETVMNLLTKSILGFNPNTTIQSAVDPVSAMSILQQKRMDCVFFDAGQIVDLGEDGFSHFRGSFPLETQIIISGYANNLKSLPDSIRKEYQLISKPFDQRQLSDVYQHMIGQINTEISQPASLSVEQYKYCQERILSLRHTIAARCILLSDSVGRVLVSAGDISNLEPELITSLLGGGIATLQEAGRGLGDEPIIHLSYREGTETDLYGLNIGSHFLLVILIDKKAGFSKMGSIWYYSRQTALSINELLRKQKEGKQDTSNLAQISNDAIENELDKLFNM